MAVAPTVISATDTHRSVAAAASPQRMLYVIWALFWLIMAMVAVQEQLKNPYVRWWEPLLWEGSSSIVASIWMLVQRRSRQRYSQYLDQPLRWFGRYLQWLPVLIVTFIGGIY